MTISPAPTILVVDDELGMRKIIQAILVKDGFQVVLAENGRQALEKAAEHKPDLILMDIMMPELNGFKTTEALRKDAQLQDIPIVMLTTLSSREDYLHAIEVGVDDFLNKPIDQIEVIARVRSITRLNRYKRMLAERTRFFWIAEYAQDGYLLLDSADGIVYANPKARLYLGLPPDDEAASGGLHFLKLARGMYELHPEEVWEGWPEAALLRLGRPAYLVQPESPTAQAFWLQVEPLELPAGADAAYLLRLHDATAELANSRDIRSFQRVVTHKLVTPLSQIMTTLDLLEVRAAKLSPEELIKGIKVAQTGAHRLHNQIRDLLQYTQMGGFITGERGFCFEELEALILRTARGLKIEQVSVNIPPEVTKIRLHFSTQALEMTLLETMENTVKFHPQKTPRLKIEAFQIDERFIGLRISDDGVHLTPAQLASAWTPYYQGEKYFTGETGGSGLGLPLIASLVWQAGGKCRLYNRPEGPGVIVELKLPINLDVGCQPPLV